MERDEILILCNSNSEVIVSYIADLESRYNELESQNIELRERINELESLLNQSRQNGNKPPSTGFFGNKKHKLSSSREPSEKLPGGQKGHPGFTLSISKHPDEIITNRLCNCKYCGQSIQETKVIDHEKRQKFDISINHKVTEYRSEICLLYTSDAADE